MRKKLKWVGFEQLICMLFEIFVEWCWEFFFFLNHTASHSYGLLWTHGKRDLCYIIFRIKRANLFTGLYARLFSICFLYLCSRNPYTQVRQMLLMPLFYRHGDEAERLLVGEGPTAWRLHCLCSRLSCLYLLMLVVEFSWLVRACRCPPS